jgi:hypothetical protein
LLDEAALYEQYTRVISTEPALNEETEDVCALLKVSLARTLDMPQHHLLDIFVAGPRR